ncbi:unnamed protein product, partial [Brassica oleracea]
YPILHQYADPTDYATAFNIIIGRSLFNRRREGCRARPTFREKPLWVSLDLDSGGVLLLLNRSIRDHVSLRISFSSNSPNTTEARTSPITEARPSPIWNILSQLYFKQTNRYFSGLFYDDGSVAKNPIQTGNGNTS